VEVLRRWLQSSRNQNVLLRRSLRIAKEKARESKRLCMRAIDTLRETIDIAQEVGEVATFALDEETAIREAEATLLEANYELLAAGF
jgi:hypothetical protein